jgi:hypothetical protein
MIKHFYSAALILASVLPGVSQSSINIANNTTDVVHLRTDCTGIANCATTMHELLDWTWDTRQPSASNPLLVDIGPGEFLIHQQYILPNSNILNTPRSLCKDNGFVTFRGAGRDTTVIGGVGKSVGLSFDVGTRYPSTMSIANCENLTFEDMTIRSGLAIDGIEETAGNGILWTGGGSSVWTNVGVEAAGYGWIDVCDASGDVGEHKWFASSIKSGPGGYYNVGYASMCGDNSFYGGEIIAKKDGILPTSGTLLGAAAVSNNGNIAIYGALVRAINPADGAAQFGTYSSSSVFSAHGGLLSKDGGTIHMHGGIVSVRSESNLNSSVYGLVVDGTGTIHTPDTAFGLKASGTGQVTRIVDISTNAKSPFQWPPSATPPAINSLTGSDTFIETDCAADGNCDSGTNTHPHLMIHDQSCNNGNDPWFNSTLGACRGVNPNP